MRRLVASVGAAAIAALALAPAPAEADPSEFGLAEVSASLSSARAGAHPDFRTTFGLKTNPASKPNAFGLKEPDATLRDLTIALPPGLLGNPNALPQCTLTQLATYNQGGGCPNASQVGVTRLYAYSLDKIVSEPIYLMRPPADGSSVARLGLVAGIVPTVVEAHVRSEGDFGVNADLESATAIERVVKAETTIWGVPDAEAHDTERQTPAEALSGVQESSPRPPAGVTGPFLTNPTRCGVSLHVGFAADSYASPAEFSKMGVTMPGLTGCDLVKFSPDLSVKPTSREAAEQTGLDADLSLTQDESVGGTATSPVHETTVTLPRGMTIASGAADGLVACSAAQVVFESREPSSCPEASQIGTAEIDTPLLSRPLHATIYQRTPEGERLARIWLVADELGLHLKLAGEVHLDEGDGQITSTFEGPPATEGLPQAPVREFKLHFREGGRAPLANPLSCGTYQTHWSFTPWSSSTPVEGDSPMTIDAGCDTGGFAPKLTAGSLNPLAGAFSDFVTTLTSETGEQNPASIDVTLPSGVLAKVAGVPFCEGAALTSGECPASSKIGSVVSAVGPGPSPLWIPQPGKSPTAIYLAGPYKGAPVSLVVVVPAQAGPFDLGNVVTRAGIYVAPETGQATVKADPLPQILRGIPVVYRTIHVDVNRPEFALNPTGCNEKQVSATVTSIHGAVAHPASRFQVSGCRGLGFEPSLSIHLLGTTHRGGHPRLRAVLKMPPGGANIGVASVALPRSEFIDNAHFDTVCTRVQFAAHECPAGSIYGNAIVKTPLLDEPLTGPIYLRSNPAHELPDLVLALKGPPSLPIEFDAAALVDSVNGGIRTTFESVPDAPVESVVVNMQGGNKSLIENSENLCARVNRATAKFTGQNGKRALLRPVVKPSCAKGRHKKHKRR
jgi:hypothetical protein